MRVLFLYPRTLDSASSMGGVAEFLCSLAPALKSHEVDSVIYAGDKTITQLKAPVQLITQSVVYNGPFIKPGFFYSRRKLAPVLDLCAQIQFDVIHAQGTYTAGFMAMQISKRTGIPFVVTSHSDILSTNSKRMRRRNVQRRCRQVLKHAAAVTHLTPMMEEISHQLWDTRAKSTVIGNGIDCELWHPYAALPERNYMLGIGRLEKGKGFHVLIDMYARLLKMGVTTSLVIAGRGSEENNLYAQARQYGINLVTDCENVAQIPEKSIVFTGYVRDDVKRRLIGQSRFVLFATQPDLWEEAFGIVQLEAMAAGKPVIASDTNVTRFLRQSGLRAVIVEAANIKAWAEEAYHLLHDANTRREYGSENLLAAARFGWLPIASQYRDVYSAACKL
ncbi:Glycogen synthase [Aquicella siphonis]|uniref:Glycogen synthase n=1 Tax=Aquicella siphonis TaxID=254247 RepID=A0A5E4PFE6_9COXI|nr:glycosyltransferase family 4 protein [Aquicella siphonis]VVC75710.1 Glycogen synthase [Aquicella siphonis]